MKYNRFEKYKIMFHADKLQTLSEGKICAPAQMVVYPSYVCNYKCGHCIMSEERRNQVKLPDFVFDKIVDDCQEFNIESVIFSGGGEPLTHKMTLPTAKRLQCAGIDTSLNTNGWFLEDDMTMIDHLRVSVDAGTRETYKRVHGVDGWNRITENLRRLKKKELGLAYLIDQNNWNEIYEFLDWAQQFDYDFIHIRPAYLDAEYIEGNAEELREHINQIHSIKEYIEKNYDNVFFRVDKFDGFWTEKLYKKCYATPIKAVLCADGQFAVCQDNFIKFGNYITSSFAECWWSEEHQKALDSICINKCPRCVEVGYNEIIQNCFVEDSIKRKLI